MLVGGMPLDGQYDDLVAWFAHEGIQRERIRFHARCEPDAYLALHHQVDICLDTFPYSGGTTTAHALCMGVPTLSLAGRTPQSRHGAAILGHVGLDAFIAHDAEDFEAKGWSWATDLGALGRVRAELRERLDRSVVQRPGLIAAGLEHALRTIWQRWCTGLPAEALDASSPSAHAVDDTHA
jgi:predicted O-linked N-acetylglucosamine transferase (SPINDLY family)